MDKKEKRIHCRIHSKLWCFSITYVKLSTLLVLYSYLNKGRVV